MVKRFSLISAAVLAVVAAALTMAGASSDDQAPSCDVKNVRITGENVALLEAVGGGEADENFGKLYALKVEKAEDDAGNCLDDALKGRILCYAPTKSAAALLSGELKGKVTVSGKLVGGSVLVVESAAAAEAKTDEDKDAGDSGDEWEEIGVKTLSQQQVI